LEQYELLPEDASGAGSSLEKQEGNVHGYEQEEVTEKGETVGKIDILEGDSKSKKDEIEEVVVEVLEFERGSELSGSTQKAKVFLYIQGLNDSILDKEKEFPVVIKAWLSTTKVYIFKIRNIKGILRKEEKSNVKYSIEITESIIAKGYKVSIDLKINNKYPTIVK
jgi:hypothetical protein